MTAFARRCIVAAAGLVSYVVSWLLGLDPLALAAVVIAAAGYVEKGGKA